MMLQNNFAIKYAAFHRDIKRRSYQNLNRNFLSTYEKGISAERIASKMLISRGYEILGQRIRTGYGEIDILAKKENDVVAVEVKQRKTLEAAKCCIPLRQRRRIFDAISFIASERNKPFENYRVDVICFDAVGRFEHIENAFSVENLVAC